MEIWHCKICLKLANLLSQPIEICFEFCLHCKYEQCFHQCLEIAILRIDEIIWSRHLDTLDSFRNQKLILSSYVQLIDAEYIIEQVLYLSLGLKKQFCVYLWYRHRGYRVEESLWKRLLLCLLLNFEAKLWYFLRKGEKLSAAPCCSKYFGCKK